jgi:hypothetical protein
MYCVQFVVVCVNKQDGWWQAKKAVSQYCGVESEDDPSGCTVDTFANPDNMEIALDRSVSLSVKQYESLFFATFVQCFSHL